MSENTLIPPENTAVLDKDRDQLVRNVFADSAFTKSDDALKAGDQASQSIVGTASRREQSADSIKFKDIEFPQEVLRAVSAWKEYNGMTRSNVFSRTPENDQLKQKERELLELINSVDKDKLLQEASIAYLQIQQNNLAFLSNSLSNRDNPQALLAAKAQIAPLNDIISFAESKRIPKSDIEKVAIEWKKKDQEVRKQRDLEKIQKLTLELNQLSIEARGFPINPDPNTEESRTLLEQQRKKRSAIWQQLDQLNSPWHFTEEEKNALVLLKAKVE